MAVVSITEHPTARSGSQNRLWQRTYSRAWRIVTDDPADGAATVLASVPVGIGQSYSTGAESDPGSYCVDIKVQCVDDANGWIATAEFGPYDATQKPLNPLEEQPAIAWEGQPYQKPADFDAEGNPILNTAGDPFDPPVMQDYVRPILRITRNQASYDPSLAYMVNGSVNSTPFFGADPGIVKVQVPPGARVYSPEIGYFWVVQYEFIFNPDGWLTKVLNQGFRQIDPSDSTKQIDITKNGVPVSTPALLDDDGQPLAVGADPVFLEFQLNKELDFSIFGFNSFYEDITS